MKKSVKFSPEFRDRAMRMVTEYRVDYPSLWSAVESIAAKIGCTPHTLLTCVRQHERESGQRKGPTTTDQKCVKELEREVKRDGLVNPDTRLSQISASMGDGNRLPRSRSNEKV